ncbi:hypothetical protein IWX49DRAFT_331303 [Phyllosticta citricarpa]|uniref:Uncharacterized protein n=1 Tax=Phyllosticta paracitricarpa TaxID=2016321 RepID=A0ABR1MWV5_9PEZI
MSLHRLDRFWRQRSLSRVGLSKVFIFASPPPLSRRDRPRLHDRRMQAKPLVAPDDSPRPATDILSATTALRRIALDRDVTIPCPTKESPTIAKLNSFLRRGINDPANDNVRKNLWKAYARTKLQHPDALRLIPDDAWIVLWKTQSHVSTLNDNRMAHMKELANDMQSIGSSTLRVAYLDALSESGKEMEAASEWINWHKATQGPWQPEFLEQGIKLTVSVGMINYAQHILWGLDSEAIPRASRYIFTALVQDGTPDAVERARKLYFDIWSLFGDEMSDSDYEFYWMGFSRNGAGNLANQVFQNMVRSAQFEANFQKDRTKFYLQFTNIVESASSVADVHGLFTPLVDTLVGEFNTGLFFNSWLKRLLDFNDTDASRVVVELAYEKGCVPAPRMMNKIVSIWISQEKATTRDFRLAEEISMRMVERRLEIVRRRVVTKSTIFSKRKQKLTIWEKRPVPPATSATFTNLLHLYIEKYRTTMNSAPAVVEFKNLMFLLFKCALPLDSIGLSIVLQHYLQNHNTYTVKEKFKNQLENAPDWCAPRGAAIEVLWNTCYLTKNRRRSNFMRRKGRVDLDSAVVMQQTLQSLDKSWRNRGRDPMDVQMLSRNSNKIIRCFCEDRNYAGALMALYVLAERFGIYPSAKIIEIVARSVASLAFRTRSPLQRRTTAESPLFRQEAAKLIQVMSKMFSMRVELESMKGDVVDGTRRAQITLETITKFLRITMLRSQSPAEIEDSINMLRTRWGVEKCSTGESTAFDVYIELHLGDALKNDGGPEGEETLSIEEKTPTGEDAVPEEEPGHASAEKPQLESQLLEERSYQEAKQRARRSLKMLQDREQLQPQLEPQTIDKRLHQKTMEIGQHSLQPLLEKEQSQEAKQEKDPASHEDPLQPSWEEKKFDPQLEPQTVDERLLQKAMEIEQKLLQPLWEEEQSQEVEQEQHPASIEDPLRENEPAQQDRGRANEKWLSGDEPTARIKGGRKRRWVRR